LVIAPVHIGIHVKIVKAPATRLRSTGNAGEDNACYDVFHRLVAPFLKMVVLNAQQAG
jgi:hypothetical protein